MTKHTVPHEPVTPTPMIDARQPGNRVEFRSESEFHQCWYPFALSTAIRVLIRAAR